MTKIRTRYAPSPTGRKDGSLKIVSNAPELVGTSVLS